MAITKTAASLGRRTVIIASGDLSHKLKHDGPYGFAPQGPEFDKRVTEAMAEADFLKFLSFEPDFTEAAAECGLKSFVIMAGVFDKVAVTAELLSYQGNFGVGYAVASFIPRGGDESRNFLEGHLLDEEGKMKKIREGEDDYVRLARYALETRILTGKPADKPEGIIPEMRNRRAGAFVSIKKNGNLRGCIGTISPVTASIADEIMRNALESGLGDPRFDPVSEAELEDLVYSVDILGDAEPVQSNDQLDPQKYGVIVKRGARRGLLLPALEGVNTVEEQLSIALQKGGIRPDEPYVIERFEVVRHR
jgi:AmmeMemoRadiSam system protein A